jgi:hypothetical protein
MGMKFERVRHWLAFSIVAAVIVAAAAIPAAVAAGLVPLMIGLMLGLSRATLTVIVWAAALLSLPLSVRFILPALKDIASPD